MFRQGLRARATHPEADPTLRAALAEWRLSSAGRQAPNNGETVMCVWAKTMVTSQTLSSAFSRKPNLLLIDKPGTSFASPNGKYARGTAFSGVWEPTCHFIRMHESSVRCWTWSCLLYYGGPVVILRTYWKIRFLSRSPGQPYPSTLIIVVILQGLHLELYDSEVLAL